MQFDVDIRSIHKGLFQKARITLIAQYGFTETRKPRITTYADRNGGVCHMRTMPHGIGFGFLKGVRMEDKFNLLTGRRKVMRILPVRTFGGTQIQYYFDQAIKINKV